MSASELKHHLRRLFRCMDFVSRHRAFKRDTVEARRMADVYQHLGLAWEFLALQCRHLGGWRTTRNGKSCKLCGSMRGAKERWRLLPLEGSKVIGQRALPNSKRVFPTRRQATVVNDTVVFHGARLNVQVLNRHRSSLLRGRDVTVAADRLVRLEEGGVECRFDTHLVGIRLAKRRRGEPLPFGAFPSELPRQALKRFPVLLEYDRRGRFTGLTIFRPRVRKR